jgi:Ca2+-binding EF-hand superfamily protein
MKDKDFITQLIKNNRLKEVFHTIGQIDKDHNGYVTRNEMDDILKLYH